MLGILLNTNNILFKYIGGLHGYLRRTLLLYNPNELDQVCVQATHLEVCENFKMGYHDSKFKEQVNPMLKKDV